MFALRDFIGDGCMADCDKNRFNHKVGYPPKKGDLDLNSIKKSVFFFS